MGDCGQNFPISGKGHDIMTLIATNGREGTDDKVFEVAKAFIRLSEPEAGDDLTNLKLQKLTYYAQGFNLAIYGKPLFEEDIFNWAHGPVVRSLYDKYKVYEDGPVKLDEDSKPDLGPKSLELIAEVNRVYGQFSAWKLRDMTHRERPWVETERNEVISKPLLKEFFKTLIA